MPDSGILQRTCGVMWGAVNFGYRCEGDRLWVDVDGVAYPGQFVACHALGRPYAQIMFDRKTPQGASVVLRHMGGRPLDVYTVSYDAEHFVSYEPGEDLNPGKRTEIELEGATGILIAERGSSGCEFTREADFELGPFSVELTLRR